MRKVTTIILLFVALQNVIGQNWDINLLDNINGNENRFLKNYSLALSNTTSAVVLSVPLAIGVVALVRSDKDMLYDALYVGSSVVVNQALTKGLKAVFKRPRPYETYPYLITPDHFESSKSFPSGHTSSAFSLATSISLTYPKWYVIAPSFFWAASVGYSRMNLGVHYPSDVIGGAVLGAGSAYLTYKIRRFLQNKIESKKSLPKQEDWY